VKRQPKLFGMIRGGDGKLKYPKGTERVGKQTLDRWTSGATPGVERMKSCAF